MNDVSMNNGKVYKIDSDNFARIIAIKTDQVNIMAENEMAKGPEISMSQETVVTPVQEVSPQAPENVDVRSEEVNVVVPEPVAESNIFDAPQNNSEFVQPQVGAVSATDINIPEPNLGMGVSSQPVNTQVEENINQNVFDNPVQDVASEMVAPVQDVPVNNTKSLSQLVVQYKALSSNIKEMLEYQDKLVEEMEKVMGQLKADNNAYTSAIDEMTSGFSRTA